MKERRRRAVILAAVPVEPALARYLQAGDFILACDAGYRNAARLGVRPDLVIGDFDSAPSPGADVPVLTLPHEKDDTDTHYAARWLLAHGYDEVTLLGALGGARLEHSLASIATGLYLARGGAAVCLAAPGCELRYLLPGQPLTLARADWTYLSLFPLDGPLCGVCETGTYYPLQDATLQPDYPLGVSNEFAAPTATLSCRSGHGLVVLSRSDG